MGFTEINYLGVLLAAIAGMISGAVWYGVFASQWMKAVGYSEQPRPNPKIYVVAIICQLVIAIMLSSLFGHFDQVTISAAIISAFFIWLGFCVAPMAVNHRFQDKGWDLTIIDGGYWLVVFVLQAIIIAWIGS